MLAKGSICRINVQMMHTSHSHAPSDIDKHRPIVDIEAFVRKYLGHIQSHLEYFSVGLPDVNKT